MEKINMKNLSKLLIFTVSLLAFTATVHAQGASPGADVLDKAKYSAEVGNYAQAVELLEGYKNQYGESIEFLKVKARVLALAGDSKEAIKILEPLLVEAPNDYGLLYSRTLAVASGHNSQNILSNLSVLSALDPSNIDTQNINRVLRTPLKPEVSANFAFQNNSDGTSYQSAGVSASKYYSPTVKIFGGVDSAFLHATPASGFAATNGNSEVTYNRAWLGAKKIINQNFEIDAMGGDGRTAFHNNGIYEVGLNYFEGNQFNGRLSHRQDLLTVSPLAASMGILRNSNRIEGNWMPDYKNTISSSFNYDTYSGNNTRWEFDLAPRRAFIRNKDFNLDLGLSGQWLGFSQPNALGYYSPSSYARYAATFFSYWKIDDDSGLSVVGSAGPQKGDPMTAYRMSGGIGAEYYYGIYRDLFFKASVSSLNYGATQGANYRSNNLMFSLAYRGF
jgi:tetratricopeptide (TPR) repeat protein